VMRLTVRALVEHAGWIEWSRGGNHAIRGERGISGLREIT
jgi:hypothetical protein